METMFIDDDYDDNPHLFSEILPGLWQGGTAEGDQIHASKVLSSATDNRLFTAVVTLDSQSQPVSWGIKEYRYGFADGPIEKYAVKNILAAADWAYSEWKDGETVLIRCQAGANRSGLVMALVLMKEGLSAQDAIDAIRSKRSFALSNSAFVKWLLAI